LVKKLGGGETPNLPSPQRIENATQWKCFFYPSPSEGKNDQKIGSVFGFFFEFFCCFTAEFGHFLITNFWGKMLNFVVKKNEIKKKQ
jgi:hypothetical protein